MNSDGEDTKTEPIAEARVNEFPESHSKLLYQAIIEKAKILTK